MVINYSDMHTILDMTYLKMYNENKDCYAKSYTYVLLLNI